MSHDIRTPMNAIIGMTSIALMNLDDGERVADCLNKIHFSSRHLLGLINEVLDMSKIESGRIALSEEAFSLPEVLQSILSIISAQTEAKKQRLELTPFHIIHKNVMGDPTRLQQMLINFLANAVKFTGEGGTISFHVDEKESEIDGSARYEFVIEDNGIGMEESFIAQSIVQMMNGAIQAESRLGQGTRFTVEIYLKLHQTESAERTGGDSDELGRLMGADYGDIRILLVEDNALNIEIAAELLSAAGIRVETAMDGQEAVERVKSRPAGYYSLIFMDIQMPKMNGYEAAREIRASGRNDLEQIPIVAMSADAFSDDVKRAMDAGMNDHVAKPVELKRLLDTLEKWVGRIK